MIQDPITPHIDLEDDYQNYQGEMKNGRPDGFGKQKYADGKEFEGYWKDGVAEGNGTLKHPNGDVF